MPPSLLSRFSNLEGFTLFCENVESIRSRLGLMLSSQNMNVAREKHCTD